MWLDNLDVGAFLEGRKKYLILNFKLILKRIESMGTLAHETEYHQSRLMLSQ